MLAALIADAGAGGTGLTTGQLAEAARSDDVEIPETVANVGIVLAQIPGRPFRLIMQDLRYQLVLSAEAPPLPQWRGVAVDLVTRQMQHDDDRFGLTALEAGVLAALIADAGADRVGLTAGQLADAVRTDEAEIPPAVAELGLDLGDLAGRPFRLIRPDLRYQLVLSAEAAPLPQWHGLAVDPVSGQMQYGGFEAPLPAPAAGVLAALIADARADEGGLTVEQLADGAGLAEAGVTEAEIPETVAELDGSLRELEEQQWGQRDRIPRVIREGSQYRLVSRDSTAYPVGDEHVTLARPGPAGRNVTWPGGAAWPGQEPAWRLRPSDVSLTSGWGGGPGRLVPDPRMLAGLDADQHRA